MPKGYEQAIQAVSEIFPSERKAIRSFFERVRNAVQYFPTYEFNDSRMEIPAKDIFETSLADVVASLTSSPELQCVLYGHCPLHGVAPADVAFGFHALVVDSLLRGPYGFRSGGDSLTEKLRKQLEDAGGRLLTRKRVTRLIVKEGTVREVRTEDGDAFSGEWIISAVHPKTTLALCDDQAPFSSLFKNRIAGLREGPGFLGISALLSKPPFNPLRNYYFFDSANPGEFLKAPKAAGPPSAVFLSAARREGSGPFPVNVHCQAPVEWFSAWRTTQYGRRCADYKEFKTNLAENAFATIERYYPGIRDHVVRFAVSTPLSNSHFNGSPEGSAYGLYHSIQNTGPRAIGPRTKILNLLLTGQNTLFPGLLGAAISGLRTSGHVIGIKPMLSELKELGGA